MDIVALIVFIIAWILSGLLAGFMVYVTPEYNKGHIIAAVVVSWLFAMIAAGLIYLKRNPLKQDKKDVENIIIKEKAVTGDEEKNE